MPQRHCALHAQQAFFAFQEKQREKNGVSNQAALLRGGALDALLVLALLSGGVPSPAVRAQVRRSPGCPLNMWSVHRRAECASRAPRRFNAWRGCLPACRRLSWS